MKIWAWQLGCWYSIDRCQAASPVGSGAGMTKCSQVLNHAWRWLCYVPAESQRVCSSMALVGYLWQSWVGLIRGLTKLTLSGASLVGVRQRAGCLYDTCCWAALTARS